MKNYVGILFAASLTLGACGSVSAADYRWTGGGVAGRWTDAHNWSPSTGYPKGGDRAIFATNVTMAVTITENIDIGAGKLTLTNDVNHVLTFDCSISGTDGSIHKDGGGELHLKKANTFTGGFTQMGIYPCAWKSGAPYPDGYQSRVDTFIYDGDAFGTGPVSLDMDGGSHGTRLKIMASMTIPNDVQLSEDGSSAGNVNYLGGNGQVVHWTGYVHSTMRYWCSDGNQTGTKVYFDGPTKFTGWTSWDASIEHFFNAKAELSTGGTLSPPGGAKFYFNVSGNRVATLACNSDFYLGAEDALDNGDSAFTVNFSKNGWFHLDGHDQAYGNLAAMGLPANVVGGYGYESPAGKSAVLALTGKVPKTLSFMGDFSGAAGLWFAPVTTGSTFTVSQRIQSSRGTMRVGGEGNVLRFGTDSGFVGLSNLQVDAGGTLNLASDAKDSFANVVAIPQGTTEWSGLLQIDAGRTLTCVTCLVAGVSLPVGSYDKSNPACSKWLRGDGRLVVTEMNTWTGRDSKNWNSYVNWTAGHVPAAGESARIANGDTVLLPVGTAPLGRLEIAAGSTLAFSSWESCVTAETIVVEGVLTGTGPFTTAPDKPEHRVHLRCTDLVIAETGSIDMTTNGWAGGISSHPEGYGPGRSYNKTDKCGASHGGYGSIAAVYQNAFGRIYDDPLAPTLPGSGAVFGTSNPYNNGTAGGGAILIEADGVVTVNGSILACGGDAVRTYSGNFSYCGSGGSIWIKCAKLTGKGGEIRADGGNGVIGLHGGFRQLLYQLGDVIATNASYTGWAGCGGGGMIRIEYSAAQRTSSLVNMTISAAGGVHLGRVMADGSSFGALTVATEDKYRTEADLGTLTFTDRCLIDQMLGKGLSGRLYNVTAYTWNGDLDWERGHVRFPGTEAAGADVTFNGDLRIFGADSRLEIGGYMSRTNEGVFVDRYAGTHLNRLTVSGDLQLLDGAALDIRAAATNGADGVLAWGGLVAVSNDFLVGNGSWLYPWCEIMTQGAPRFEIGGAFTVESNATVMADRRGGMGGRGGSTQQSYYKVNGKAINAENGWGVGGGKGGSAGSHGGAGGTSYGKDANSGKTVFSGSPGDVQDDEWTAEYPGSGGGSGGWGEGGEGGGLVQVHARGRIVIDGLITANGWSSTYTGLGNTTDVQIYPMGGGSGGGISLAGAAIEGSGTLSARGGPGYSGRVTGTSTLAGHEMQYARAGGGGGRIVLAAGTNLRDTGYARWQQATNLTDSASVRARVRFEGTCDVSPGGFVWGGSDWEKNFKTGNPPPEFEGGAVGFPGTVRYKRFVIPGFLFSIELPTL